MTHNISSLILPSLKEYLKSLSNSGLDGIPLQATDHADLPDNGDDLAGKATPQELLQDETTPQTLEKIRKNLGDCHRCKLASSRTKLVFGKGNAHARMFFVGELPGAEEDRLGEPFVGQAGQMLTRLVNAMGLKREEIYICNVLKCRPPGDREAEPGEIEACAPFLRRQIECIKPEVIIALGKLAAQTLLGTKEPVSKLRNRFHDYHGIPLIPTHDPSYLFRRQQEGNNDSFWEVWDDMTQVLRMLKLPVPDKSRKK